MKTGCSRSSYAGDVVAALTADPGVASDSNPRTSLEPWLEDLSFLLPVLEVHEPEALNKLDAWRPRLPHHTAGDRADVVCRLESHAHGVGT